MSIPGFSADASLAPTSRRYGSTGSLHGAPMGTSDGMTPAFGCGLWCASCLLLIADDLTAIGTLDDFLAVPACGVCWTCGGDV